MLDVCSGTESPPTDRSGDGAALCPLTDVLIRRHGWSFFDFKITANMGARVAGKINWSKSFGAQGMCRSYLRSMKRYRLSIGIQF